MATERLITVGVDGSTGGRRALRWAIDHAAATGAAVQVVTAFTWDASLGIVPGALSSPEIERQYMTERQQLDIDQAVAATSEPMPTLTAELTQGNAVDVLVEAARRSDLLVLGSHGRGHLATALLGSVSEGCVRRGTTPVVIVPAHDPPTEAEEPRT